MPHTHHERAHAAPSTRDATPATTASTAPGPGGRAARMLALQRTAGNRALAELAGPRPTTPRPGPLPVQRRPLSVQRGWLDDAIEWAGDAVDTVTEGISAGGRAAGRILDSAVDTIGDAASYVGDRIGDALDIRENEEMLDYQEDRAELTEWKRQGMRGPRNVQAPTGIGGFGAAYDPGAQRLLIALAGGVTFNNSITFVGDVATVSHPSPNAALTGAVAAINRMPVADRRSAAAPYMWSGTERTSFLNTFNSGVRTRWSGKHDFHASRENWTDLGAEVDVTSSMHSGAKAANEHVSLTVYKTPPGGAGNVGVVNSTTGDPTAGRMTLNSPDVNPRADNLLDFSGSFTAGASGLTAAQKADLNRIAATFRGGGPGCRICGMVITQSSGGPDLDISVQGATETVARTRYSSIVSAMVEAANLDVALRTNFSYGGPGDSYTVTAGNGIAQSVAEHEAGHMFGLGDEYATGAGSMITGTGAQAGGEAEHDELAKEMGLEGAVFENNDGIMSLGSVVRPQHYSTFHWALGEITGLDWVLGPPIPVNPPGPPLGDFPAPDPTRAFA